MLPPGHALAAQRGTCLPGVTGGPCHAHPVPAPTTQGRASALSGSGREPRPALGGRRGRRSQGTPAWGAAAVPFIYAGGEAAPGGTPVLFPGWHVPPLGWARVGSLLVGGHPGGGLRRARPALGGCRGDARHPPGCGSRWPRLPPAWYTPRGRRWAPRHPCPAAARTPGDSGSSHHRHTAAAAPTAAAGGTEAAVPSSGSPRGSAGGRGPPATGEQPAVRLLHPLPAPLGRASVQASPHGCASEIPPG